MSVRGRRDRVAESGARKRMRRSHDAKPVDYLEIVIDDQKETQVIDAQVTQFDAADPSLMSPDPESVAPAPGTPISEVTQSTWPTWRNRYFVDWRENVSGQVFARCRLCNSDYYFAGAWSSFSNFSKHLAGVHSIQWRADSASAARKSAASAEPKAAPGPTDLDADLARAICHDNLPIHLLDKPAFRAWIQAATVGYCLPSVQSMRGHLIQRLYDQCKGAVEQKLSACSTFSLMIDIWSSKRMMGLITFTCSAVTKDFKRFRCFLSARKSSGRISGPAVLQLYEQVVGQWNIPRQAIVRVMTDCGQNALRNFLGMKLPSWAEADPAGSGNQPEECRNSGSWQSTRDAHLRQLTFADKDEREQLGQIEVHLRHHFQPADVSSTWAVHASCVVHQLQLVVSDGLAAIQSPMASAIGHASRIFEEIQRNEADRRLLQTLSSWQVDAGDVVGWDGQYRTLKRLIDALHGQPELQDRLHASRKLGKLSGRQIQLLDQLVLLLEPFEEACHDLQTESESIGNVIPAYLDMLTKITLQIRPPDGLDEANPPCPLADGVNDVQHLAQALRTSLTRRLSHVLDDGLYVLGAVLDPRFKKTWIKFSGRAECDVLSVVRSQLELRHRALCASGEVTDDRPATKEAAPMTRRSANRSLYSTFLEETRAASGVRMRILTELDTFLTEAVAPWEETVDPLSESSDPVPLKFWKSNGGRWPLLSLVARDVFGVPASRGNLQRLCDAAVDVISAVNNNTDVQLFDQMMFVKWNSV